MEPLLIWLICNPWVAGAVVIGFTACSLALHVYARNHDLPLEAP